MPYQVEPIEINDDDQKWLEAVYELEKDGGIYNYRDLRVQLFKKISKHYNPKNIDNRIFNGRRLTAFGITLFEPNSPI